MEGQCTCDLPPLWSNPHLWNWNFLRELRDGALKNSSLPPHLQLVYLPGEELLLCPQPSGGVGSMAHRAPIELGHEHLRGKEGKGNVIPEQNKKSQLRRKQKKLKRKEEAHL